MRDEGQRDHEPVSGAAVLPGLGPDHHGRTRMRLGELGLAGFAPYLLNRVTGRYNANLRAKVGPLGLTTCKMRVLAVLSVIEGPLIRDLALYTVTEQSTLSRALDRLQAGGLIRRDVDPQDSRGVRIFLTDAGREKFEQLWPFMASEYAAMFTGISEEERRGFVAVLQKILANIEAADTA